VLELSARDQRLDARIGLDVSERFALIGKRDDLVTACFSMRLTINRVVRLGSTMRGACKGPLVRSFKQLAEAP
jgi:hypothetical protein